MDPLFPELPDDLSGLSDDEIAALAKEHEASAELINADDQEFLAGLSAEQVIEQYKAGVENWEKLRAEQQARVDAQAEYDKAKIELATRMTLPKAEEEEDGGDDEGDEESAPEEGNGESEEAVAEAEEPKELELVTAAVEVKAEPVRMRRAPVPTPDRTPVVVEESPVGAFRPVGELARHHNPVNENELAQLVADAMRHYGPAHKHKDGGGYRSGGHMIKLASAEYPYPESRQLGNDVVANTEKIAEVIPATIPGGFGALQGEALTASGGLCAPLTPLYSMPNFATDAEPVWDALPKFQAVRGGVNVPEATYIADITTAITEITEADDALGGTFATKSCQDLTCPEYTETAVQIIAHCREYGNLNAIAWPEKIRHENELTMAALSRTSENFLLDRLKALSVNVTNGAETLGALIYVVDAIVKARFGIIGRFRMPRNSRFRVFLPYWFPSFLVLDTIQTQFDRFRSEEELVAYLRQQNIDPVFYLDSPSTGTTQLPDSAQTAAALDGMPNEVQWALHPEGAFLGLDMGSLELGIVRDSTLNSTNDFQVFGEVFRNVARIAPAQAAYWITSDICPIGQFPPAGTARTCE